MARYGPHDVRACRLLVVQYKLMRATDMRACLKILNTNIAAQSRVIRNSAGWCNVKDVQFLDVKRSPDALNVGQNGGKTAARLSCPRADPYDTGRLGISRSN